MSPLCKVLKIDFLSLVLDSGHQRGSCLPLVGKFSFRHKFTIVFWWRLLLVTCIQKIWRTPSLLYLFCSSCLKNTTMSKSSRCGQRRVHLWQPLCMTKKSIKIRSGRIQLAFSWCIIDSSSRLPICKPGMGLVREDFIVLCKPTLQQGVE